MWKNPHDLAEFEDDEVLRRVSDVGGRRPIVEELLAWIEEYPIQWQIPRQNRVELANLRTSA